MRKPNTEKSNCSWKPVPFEGFMVSIIMTSSACSSGLRNELPNGNSVFPLLKSTGHALSPIRTATTQTRN